MKRNKIHEIYVGKIKTHGTENAEDPFDDKYVSAGFKEPINDSVFLSELGLTGDEQADKRFHGGKEKALFMYPKENYLELSCEFGKEIPVGGNGENISIIGINERDVCVGDVYQLGESVIEVSQPRRPCWKPARRHRTMEFSKTIQDLGMTGWYFRVIQEGKITKGDTLKLIKRPCKEWTIKKVNDVMYVYTDNLGLAESLIDCVHIPESFKETLRARLRGEEESQMRRLYGPNINA